MPDGQIFKATYSGVAVYEMMCKGVAVMRRRQDSYLNATQILKVAGLDKPQRTRVLERDVQKGEHEKVQGGYGKYQGTWIPLERGLALAKQFNCADELRLIIEYQPEAKSPPLAPKHLVAPIPGRPPAKKAAEAAAAAARNTRRTAPPKDEVQSDEDVSMQGSEDGSGSPAPSDYSSSSPTPSPIQGSQDGYESAGAGRQRNRKRPSRGGARKPASDAGTETDADETVNEEASRNYCDEILEYFISDTNQIPQFLINPPPNFDPNMAIDDDGHTALHWASAMGRIRVVKLLLTAGADSFKTNKSGQTALMRSVMFANNYDIRKFPELYELLHKTTLNIDQFNRTVFHHIIDVAMAKGKTHAARYYMETILQRLSEFGNELADVINFQDEDGETALTMAARCRSKRLVKLLIDHGADPKIRNRDGKNSEDYILEDERFRASPILPSRSIPSSYRNVQSSYPPYGSTSHYAHNPPITDKLPLHHSVTAQVASTRCVNDISVMLHSLAASFDQELKDKERDMTQAHSLLGSIQSEILESQRAVQHLKQQSQGLEAAKDDLSKLEQDLNQKMKSRYNAGYTLYLQEKEGREHVARASSLIQDLPVVGQSSLPPEVTNGIVPTVSQDDIAELRMLYSDLPTDEEGIRLACEALRSEITKGMERRDETFSDLLKLQAEAGTGGKMNQYRKLIGIGCGGLSPAEVDEGVAMLLETLEAEEPSASAITWVSKEPPQRAGT